MDCKETQKNIRPFLDNELNFREEGEFLDHVCNCKDCMEEMSIVYLVSDGFEDFEESGDANMTEKLNKKIQTALYKQSFVRKAVRFGTAIVVFLICVLFLV